MHRRKAVTEHRFRFVGLGPALVALLGCGGTVPAQPTPASSGPGSSTNGCSCKEICQGRSGCSGSNSCQGAKSPTCENGIQPSRLAPQTADHGSGALLKTSSALRAPSPKL